MSKLTQLVTNNGRWSQVGLSAQPPLEQHSFAFCVNDFKIRPVGAEGMVVERDGEMFVAWCDPLDKTTLDAVKAVKSLWKQNHIRLS